MISKVLGGADVEILETIITPGTHPVGMHKPQSPGDTLTPALK
jgi:hypothetical protein